MKMTLLWGEERTFEVGLSYLSRTDRWTSDGSVPLTLALSRGERENCTPSRLQSLAIRFSGGLVPVDRERGDEAYELGNSKERTSASPLPRGEGKGEGERGSRQQSRLGFIEKQNTQRTNSFGITEDVTLSSSSNGSVPLTPALSRGERENCIPFRLQRLARLHFGAYPLRNEEGGIDS